MHRSLGVVIPAYGSMTMTHNVVRQCLLERALVDVVVVDNMGDYSSVGGEHVIVPPTNLGWLRGTNRGVEEAFATGRYEACAALNNDTRLSPNFFAGLHEAMRARADSGLIAPCYDDVFTAQNRYYRGEPDAFVPQPIEVDVPLIDGTCYLVTAPAYHRLGGLDAEHFGRRGWGAMEDYCLRARRQGYAVTVTRRSYLSHERGVTAKAVNPAYERYAYAELRRGMRKKWGASWRQEFEPGTVGSEKRLDRFRDWLRYLEDRTGLSRTRLGMRGMDEEKTTSSERK